MPNCWRCLEVFDIDSNDERPFVFHECEDGCMAAHDNPNLVKRYRRWTPTSKPRKKTFWQDWQHFEKESEE